MRDLRFLKIEGGLLGLELYLDLSKMLLLLPPELEEGLSSELEEKTKEDTLLPLLPLPMPPEYIEAGEVEALTLRVERVNQRVEIEGEA